MRYWKFLRTGARSPFTDHRWSPGVWAHSAATRPCAAGFHACRARDLPYWLGEELWQIELGGEVTELDHKVVASAARLVEPVAHWTSATSREFALACAGRVVSHAADELAAHSLDRAAEQLRAATTPTEWTTAAETAATAAERIEPALRLCGYVLDVVEILDAYPTASSAYLAARVADERTPPNGPDGYETERTWQAGWLADRLGLHADGQAG